MRILQVAEACSAGVGRHVASLCRGLVAEGHEVSVAYAPYRLDGAFERFIAECAEDIRFHPLEVRREISPLDDLRGVGRLARLIRREGPFDVVHGHSSKGGALARIAGRLCNLPTVYTPHSLIMASPEVSRRKAVLYGAIERSLGRFATSRMIAVSAEEREFILDLGLVSEDRARQVPNCMEERDFKCLRSDSSTAGNELRPLTFGSTMRFSAQKAPKRLIEAFIQVSELLPDLSMRLVVAGDGELYEEVRETVEARGWSDRIILPGWSDTPEILRQLDVFVVSSLYEGFSYAVLEAMAAGLPLVGSNVFGMQDTVGRVPGNLLVPPGDTGALAHGMARLATVAPRDAVRRTLAEIGVANCRHVRENFVQNEATRRTLGVYAELGGSGSRREGFRKGLRPEPRERPERQPISG